MMNIIEQPYEINALEPVISERTLSFHHGKHLQGYVDNLNKLLPGTPYETMPLEDIVKNSEGTIFNNAGQILNPLLTFDVWEHAYYLDYQNRRAAHLSELWKIIDWKIIESRYNG